MNAVQLQWPCDESRLSETAMINMSNTVMLQIDAGSNRLSHFF